MKLDYNKVKGGVLAYSKVTPDYGEGSRTYDDPVPLYGKDAPTKFIVYGNDEEGNELKTGKLRLPHCLTKFQSRLIL